MSAGTSTTPATSLAPASAASVGTAAVAGPGRRTRLAVRTLQIVLSLFFAVASAGPKLVGHSSAAEGFDRIGYGDWYMYLVGGLELAGAVALVIPVLSGVSALALMGLMIGAFVTQVTVFEGENALTPVIFFALLAVVAVVRRRHNAELVALVRDRF